MILRRSTRPPAIDAAGERDYGHMEAFCPATDLRDDVWELAGEWGEALVRRPTVHVQLDTAKTD